MPRIRTIEPDLFDHPKLKRMRAETRLLYIGLICRLADDEGRFIWDLDHIRSTIFPADGVTNRRLSQWLLSLQRANLVLRYEVDGQAYGFLSGWFEHQVINRPSPSKLPAPPVFPASWAEVRAIRSALLQRSYGELTGPLPDSYPNRSLRTNTALRLFAQLSDEERQEIQAQIRSSFSECSMNTHEAFMLDMDNRNRSRNRKD